MTGTHNETAPDGYLNRRFVRHPRTVPVTVETNNGPLRAKTANLSLGGAFVLCERRPEPNSLVDVTLYLEGKPVEAHCRVVHRNPTGIGLAFVHIKDGGLEQVSSYFRKHDLATLTASRDRLLF